MGAREAHLAHALSRLTGLGRLTGVSGVYETDPEGFTDQPAFLNMATRLQTPLEPLELLEATCGIERERGRVRTFRNAPRTLDIDILLFGERSVEREDLSIPHPRMADRAFVLIPLLELEPEVVEPRTGRSYAEFLKELRAPRPDRHTGDMRVRRVMEGEELLDGADA